MSERTFKETAAERAKAAKNAAKAAASKLRHADYKKAAESVREKARTFDIKKAARDFWYGKPHEERRLGDLYIGNTGLYKHREWRGFKDTMYYFHMIWK